MADPKIAIAITLQHEGGYDNDPNDPGGATNMGIEQRDLPNIPIQTLTVAQAVAYYLENYWKPLYSDIVSQEVASKLFDMGVLFGVGTAVKAIQTALEIHADGVFGPVTLEIVNSTADVLWSFKHQLIAHVTALVTANPKLGEFLVGWERRVNL